MGNEFNISFNMYLNRKINYMFIEDFSAIIFVFRWDGGFSAFVRFFVDLGSRVLVIVFGDIFCFLF